MFIAAKNPDLRAPPITVGEMKPLDWSERLSIDMIRTHTKTDDVPAVTDAQLKMYRDAAIEAAEFYTGLLLSCQRSVTEPIQRPFNRYDTPFYQKRTYKHRLQYPCADGLIYVYGGSHPDENRSFMVVPGTRTIHIPVRTGMLDMHNCCDPCSSHHLNGGLMAVYRAGFKDPSAVPAGVILGMLLFIAWIIEHPGDELLTQRNTLQSKSSGVQASNNIAQISGALETWRQYDPEAI